MPTPHLAAPFLTDRASLDEAVELLRALGDEAGWAAAERAEHYRGLGNHIHCARWRQIERMVVYLSIDSALDTVH